MQALQSIELYISKLHDHDRIQLIFSSSAISDSHLYAYACMRICVLYIITSIYILLLTTYTRARVYEYMIELHFIAKLHVCIQISARMLQIRAARSARYTNSTNSSSIQERKQRPAFEFRARRAHSTTRNNLRRPRAACKIDGQAPLARWNRARRGMQEVALKTIQRPSTIRGAPEQKTQPTTTCTKLNLS